MEHMPKALNSLGASRLCRTLDHLDAIHFPKEVEMGVNAAADCVGGAIQTKRGVETSLSTLHTNLNDLSDTVEAMEASLISVLSEPDPQCPSEEEAELSVSPTLRLVLEANQKVIAVRARLNTLRARLEL